MIPRAPRPRLPRFLPRVPAPIDVSASDANDPLDETPDVIDAPDTESDGPRIVTARSTAPAYDVMLGATSKTPQFGILGHTDVKDGGDKIAVDLNGCNTISLFGVQGSGKSYTLGSLVEMAATEVQNINCLPVPLGVVVFHYHKNDTYEPEQACATEPNDNQPEVARLLREYGARPMGLRDVVILTPEAKVPERQQEFPDAMVRPLRFGSAEIGPEGWKFLLGACGNKSLYVLQMISMLRQHRGKLSVEELRESIRMAGFEPTIQKLAEERVDLAAPYIDDETSLESLLRPGRMVIVDLRDEWIEKEEALGLFVVMLRIFGRTMFRGERFSKLIVFDEAHKYISDSNLIGEVVECIRQIRHEQNTIVIASQDPISVPRSVVELTTILVLHRMTSPQWTRHLQGTTAPLKKLDCGLLARLAPGEALVWAQRSTDERFTTGPRLVRVRPRFTKHGGGTRTAVR